MGSCLHHSQLPKLSPPAAFSKVYKDECTLCFKTVDASEGLDVCLSCYHGGCIASSHSMRHYRKTGHSLALNIKRNKVAKGGEGEQQPRKMQKVEIKPEQEPEYSYVYEVKCHACGTKVAPDAQELGEAGRQCVKTIISSMSAQKRIEIQTWQEDEITACEHTRTIVQESNQLSRLQARDRCSQCEMKDNLWMCLICGSIGCGRKQYDGSGGNGHGAEHFDSTKHAVAVKLGTITPAGAADVFCYTCQEMRVDPNLSQHLATFGIDVADVERTERTMAELQLEQNLNFDFSMVSDDGKQLESVSGPGLLGLKNLGNSCYLSSVVQCLFTLPNFRERYAHEAEGHHAQCQRDSPACFVCQSSKLAKAIWTDEHSSVSPWMFKAVATTGHGEFSTTKQQDASEFLAYLFKVIQRSDPSNLKVLVNPFTFTQQQTISCPSCGDHRVQQGKATQLPLQLGDSLNASNLTIADSLELKDMLTKTFSPELLDSVCSKCGGSQRLKTTKLTCLPEYLILTVSRYVLRNWVPTKIDMAINVPFEDLDLSPFMEEAKEPQEEVDRPEVDQAALEELLGMGFPRFKAQKALVATNNLGLEAAMNWILENGDSIDNEDGKTEDNVPDDAVAVIIDAGFSRQHAMRALRETGNDLERAFDWALSHQDGQADEPQVHHSDSFKDGGSTKYDLVSFISHKGPSVHCGHYIAHVLHPDLKKWIMFNDDRVVLANPQPPRSSSQDAYVYIYCRRRV